MATLTMNVGGSTISVAVQRAGRAEPALVGGLSRSFAGAEHTSIRAQRGQIPVILMPVSATVAASIETLFANGAQVPCAGDVFNNGGATVVCSATITRELDATSTWWTLSMKLSEVGTPIIAPTTTFLLTGAILSGSNYATTPNPSYSGDTPLTFNALGAASPTPCGSGTCAITSSASPERTWLSVPLNPGVVSGTPTFRFRSGLSLGISNAGKWAVMDTVAKLYHVRGGSDIAGPFTTGFMHSDWTPSSEMFGTVTSSIVLNILSGDRLRVELWSRIALKPTFSDDGNRQAISHGVVSGPLRPSVMIVTGTITA
jgi:hypothetical protein